MPALLDTTIHERTARGPKASRAIALSFHDHQKGGAGSTSRRLSRARGHGVVRVNHVVEADHFPLWSALTHLLPVDWRRLVRRPFPIHVSARGVLLSRLSRKRVCSTPLGHTRAYSHDLTGANRSVVQSAPRKHVSRRLAYVGKHLRRLSYSPSLAGSNNASKRFQKIGKVCQNGGTRD